MYQPKTGQPCNCKRGQARDNCPACEGTGQRIDFAAIRARTKELTDPTEINKMVDPTGALQRAGLYNPLPE